MIGILMLIPIIPIIFYPQPMRAYHFGYSLEDQQNWHELNDKFYKCKYGVYQTPIHIQDHHILPIIMPALELAGYENFLPSPLQFSNNGHTVKLTMGDYGSNSLITEYPNVGGALLTSKYKLLTLHFHWGEDNARGSEHVINNVRYPMELHLVHQNVKYNTTEEALENRDGLVVLAVFFQLRMRDNRGLHPFVDKLRMLTKNGDMTELNVAFTLMSLLPRRSFLQQFLLYEGSLTTPPCSESVTWIIFTEPTYISFRQMEMFRRVGIRNNYRELQVIGQRKVYMRRPEKFFPINSNFMIYDKHNITARSFWLH